MRVFYVSENQKRDKENVLDKIKPHMSFRMHDTDLHDFTFSCARTQDSHAAEMISVRSSQRNEEEKQHSRAVSVI